MSDLDQVACCIGAAAFVIMRSKKIKNKRRWWERKLFQRRKTYSGENFISDLHDGDLFSNFTRMSSIDFEF